MRAYFRDAEQVELNVGDEVAFSLSNSSSKLIAENVRRLKTGTILSMVSDEINSCQPVILFISVAEY